MSLDYTQSQTAGDRRRSEELSLQSRQPPTLSGYQILRPLGEGAFGQVWLASDLNTHRPVAIKCYLHRGSLNMELLRREVSLLADMSAARHVVQVLKVGWDHDPPYYVMEFLENGSLEDLVRAKEELSVAQTVNLMREIAEGLSFAHGKGILHCDLKPANVLLDHSFRPRLADFGQGRMAGDTSASLGTLFYMAPEQADIQATPDVTWDVYALGAIAYTLLVGAPPYRSPQTVEALDTTSSVLDRLQKYRQLIQNSPRPRLHYRRRGIDKHFAQIIDRCLQVNPRQRFQNVQQVIGALDNRRRQRNRRPLYLLGLVGPLLLMSLMILFSARSQKMALEQSERSVVQRALESNRFAARYAARTLQSELQSLFSIVQTETTRADLGQLLKRCTEAGNEALAEIAAGHSDPAVTLKIQMMPEHAALEAYLQQRLDLLATQRHRGQSLLNSLFINDAQGTNLGIAFTDELEGKTAVSPVGQNFAFRSYFTGQRADGLPSETALQHTPTRTTRLSASFRSTSTGKWKIAVSAPIWDQPHDADQADQRPDSEMPIGVLVLTINLGDFDLLSQQDYQADQLDRMAVLFDGRSGNQRGTLLQHPYFRNLEAELMKATMIPQIAIPVINALTTTGLDNYHDPVATFDGGQRFEGPWIACADQVELPQAASQTNLEPEKSDLWILVQERKSAVAAPIESLASSLFREGILEIVTFLTVVLALWYFVFRLGQAATVRGKMVAPGSDSKSTVTEDVRL
ncbi:MAG: protein kinase [Pirellulaceae bacterium]|nr:protein kinase [Pirellulaceae bacterium]